MIVQALMISTPFYENLRYSLHLENDTFRNSRVFCLSILYTIDLSESYRLRNGFIHQPALRISDALGH
jgi:hypothetical protein